MTPIIITKIAPEHSGDWHDKPLRWQVSNSDSSNIQKFSTKKHASKFASLWRKYGFVGAMNSYMALPVDY